MDQYKNYVFLFQAVSFDVILLSFVRKTPEISPPARAEPDMETPQASENRFRICVVLGTQPAIFTRERFTFHTRPPLNAQIIEKTSLGLAQKTYIFHQQIQPLPPVFHCLLFTNHCLLFHGPRTQDYHPRPVCETDSETATARTKFAGAPEAVPIKHAREL